MQLRKKIAEQHRQEKRTEQQREHLTQYLQESSHKGYIGMGLYQREHQRDDYRRQNVRQQGVSRQAGRAPSQLSGDNSRSRSRRADQADHRTLENLLVSTIHVHEYQQGSDQRSRNKLEQQEPSMPGRRHQLVRLHFAESQQ